MNLYHIKRLDWVGRYDVLEVFDVLVREYVVRAENESEARQVVLRRMDEDFLSMEAREVQYDCDSGFPDAAERKATRRDIFFRERRVWESESGSTCIQIMMAGEQEIICCNFWHG